jgi:hypothetical protein
MDIETTGVLPREANCLRTENDTFAVFAGELRGGWGIIAPFDAGAALEDFRAAERYFYARPDRLPSERVSRVAKGEVFRFVHRALEYLHHIRNLPYAHAAYIPVESGCVFGMRIDTDGGTGREIDELFRIGTEYGLGFTWFVDVGSHRGGLGRFAGLGGHDVGVHCYEHRIFLDAARDAENIRLGRTELERAGFKICSFAAPFGFWSPDLGRAIDAGGYAYSSEFGWAYDALPHRPVIGDILFRTYQVPIHPVSIGSLRKAGYSAAKMTSYYADEASRRFKRDEPFFFYHHPRHREWKVVRTVIEVARSAGGTPITLGDYAAWWKRRTTSKLHVQWADGWIEVRFEGEQPPADIPVRVTRKAGEAAFIRSGGPVALAGLRWTGHTVFRAPADIKRVREFDLRGAIGRQFTRIQRRFP